MAAPSNHGCAFANADDCPLTTPVRRTIGDTWRFPYTLLQPKLDASGNPVLDATGAPVPDPTNPVVLTGSTITPLLYFGASIAATLALSTDADTNLALGKFKPVAPPAVTGSMRPDPARPDPFGPNDLPTRLVIVLTDSLGDVTTIARQPIHVVSR